jgi:hypothetical protein
LKSGNAGEKAAFPNNLDQYPKLPEGRTAIPDENRFSGAFSH